MVEILMSPAERSIQLPILPPGLTDEELRAGLAHAQRKLAAHLPHRPDWRDINKRARWALKKDEILLEVSMFEGELANRWHPVEVRRS